MVATVSSTESRATIVDFTHPNIYIPVTFAIPPPDTSVNVLAVIQPFQFPVARQKICISLKLMF